MANICFNDITMVGDKAILQRLQDDIERHLNENDGSIYRYGNDLYPGSNYEGWFDDVGEVTKANEEEYFLRFTVDTKWTPAMDFFVSLGASFDKICVLPDLAGYRVHSDDSEKRYNYADEFTPDWEVIKRAKEIREYFYQLEQSEGKKFPNFSLYNDEGDKTKFYLIRHYNGYNKKWLINASSDSWLNTMIEVS